MTTSAVTLPMAAVGAICGWYARTVIFGLGGPAGAEPRRACPFCAGTVLPRLWSLTPQLPPSGRCPLCRERIGPWPGAVEVAYAAALGLIVARVSAVLVLAAALCLALCAVPACFIDWADHRLPNRLTGSAYAGTITLLATGATASGQWGSLARALLGGSALGGWYLALALAGAAGWGDAKLAASVGSLLAWAGWCTLLGGAVAGFALALPYALTLLLTRLARAGDRMAFGPFMAAGAFLAVAITGL